MRRNSVDCVSVPLAPSVSPLPSYPEIPMPVPNLSWHGRSRGSIPDTFETLRRSSANPYFLQPLLPAKSEQHTSQGLAAAPFQTRLLPSQRCLLASRLALPESC